MSRFPSSFCCTATDAQLDPEFGFVTQYGNGIIDTPPHNYRGDYPPIVPTLSNAASPLASATSRVCVMSVEGDLFGFEVRPSSRTPGSTFSALEIKCDDTTLFGGFNTVVTELNYLEIINTSGQAVRAHLYGYRESTGGDRWIDQDLALSANDGNGAARRLDIDIHSYVGRGAFGTLILINDAPKGTLKADVAQYKITSLMPFDFQLVARNPMTTRE